MKHALEGMKFLFNQLQNEMKSQCKDLDVAIQVNDHIVSQRKQEMPMLTDWKQVGKDMQQLQ